MKSVVAVATRWNGLMAARNDRLYSDWAIPPGESLEEEIEVRGISPEELAGLCGVPVENLKQVFRGSREITPELAASLGKILGIGAYIWIALEKDYQETLERIGEARPA